MTVMTGQPDRIPFRKMNGLGNEIVVVDLRGQRRILTAQEARAIAEGPKSHFDQMMVLHDPRTKGTDAYVLIYNTDGSRSAACGNGTRCIGWLMAAEKSRPLLKFETEAGILAVAVRSVDAIEVDMGEPKFGWAEIPLRDAFHDTRRIELQIGPIDDPILHTPSVVNVGNPHAVFWVDDVDAIDLGRIGPMLEHHPIFPERANISVAQIVSRAEIKLRTWERGAGLTRACGSAACAAAVCAARLDRTEGKVAVTLPGGTLMIEWTARNRILMTGPVEDEYAGEVELRS